MDLVIKKTSNPSPQYQRIMALGHEITLLEVLALHQPRLLRPVPVRTRIRGAGWTWRFSLENTVKHHRLPAVFAAKTAVFCWSTQPFSGFLPTMDNGNGPWPFASDFSVCFASVRDLPAVSCQQFHLPTIWCPIISSLSIPLKSTCLIL